MNAQPASAKPINDKEETPVEGWQPPTATIKKSGDQSEAKGCDLPRATWHSSTARAYVGLVQADQWPHQEVHDWTSGDSGQTNVVGRRSVITNQVGPTLCVRFPCVKPRQSG